jgi:hypothetical protein
MACMVVAGALWAAAASADRIQVLQGSTVGGPLYDRPTEDGSALSGVITHYQIQGFRLENSGRCILSQQQTHDGFLFLYKNGFNPNSPLLAFQAGDDDSHFSAGSSEIGPLDLDAAVYFVVTAGFAAGEAGSYTTTIHCDTNAQALQGDCFLQSIPGIPQSKTICLKDRFLVAIDQVSSHATDGIATPVRIGSTDTGLFWFFDEQNWEVMIKILDACGLNDRYWVYAAGLTDRGHRIRILDSRHPELGIKTYTRALGPPAPAITDTNALGGCPPQ